MKRFKSLLFFILSDAGNTLRSIILTNWLISSYLIVFKNKNSDIIRINGQIYQRRADLHSYAFLYGFLAGINPIRLKLMTDNNFGAMSPFSSHTEVS